MKYKSNTLKTLDERQKLSHFYTNYFYNIFMGAYEWTGDLDYRQKQFLGNEFWCKGTISALKIPIANMLCLTPYSPTIYDLYNYPIYATPIRLRNGEEIKFIPDTPQKVDNEIVLGWAQKNKKSIYEIVSFYIEKIINVEMTIKNQLTHHKNPFTFVCNPESQQKFKKYFEDIVNDEEALFIDADDPQNINILLSNTPFIIDKLQAYKKELINECLTYLGVDNLSVEKKERLIVDEAESNDALVIDFSDSFIENFKDFCDRVKNVLGITIDVKAKSRPKEQIESEKKGSKSEDDLQQ